jgi:phytoene/squalene synthetase
MIRGDGSKDRRSKYQYFLMFLRIPKYIIKERGNFLESYYVFMREIDDIADRDKILIYPEKFIERKIEFARNPANPSDELDDVLLYCYKTCNSLGIDLKQETEDLLSSMLFDARRYGKMKIFQEEELFYHFNLLDIRGCEQACLKFYNEDPRKLDIVKHLGLASRIYCNLRDYEEDIQKGFVNISEEDIIRLGISINNLADRNSNQIKIWFKEQAAKGIDLLEEHKKIIGSGNFGLLAKLTFPIVYEIPARKYFNRILAA